MKETKLSIKVYGDGVLRGGCSSVDELTDEDRELLDRMLTFMYKSNGIGLAAPQIGIKKELAVIDFNDKIYKFANPKIIHKEGNVSISEGCLSLPDIQIEVPRFERITVEYLDYDNEIKTIELEGILAIVFQHEIDHLHGKLISDYLPFYKRLFMYPKLLSCQNKR